MEQTLHSPIIGFHGFAQTGKDTCVKRLVQMHGFTRLAFADPVRAQLELLNPFLGDGTRLRHALTVLGGWEGLKKHRLYRDEIRRLMQIYATELTRGMFGDDVWVKETARMMAPGPTAFSDVREICEATWIRSMGGVIVEVTAPGVGPVNGHSSEGGLPPEMIDFTLKNDGTLDELWAYVDAMVVQPQHV